MELPRGPAFPEHLPAEGDYLSTEHGVLDGERPHVGRDGAGGTGPVGHDVRRDVLEQLQLAAG